MFGWPDLKYTPHSIHRVTSRTTEIQPQWEVRVMICWKRCSTMPGTKETHSGFQNEHELKLIRWDAETEHPFAIQLLLTRAALLSACSCISTFYSMHPPSPQCPPEPFYSHLWLPKKKLNWGWEWWEPKGWWEDGLKQVTTLHYVPMQHFYCSKNICIFHCSLVIGHKLETETWG